MLSSNQNSSFINLMYIFYTNDTSLTAKTVASSLTIIIFGRTRERIKNEHKRIDKLTSYHYQKKYYIWNSVPAIHILPLFRESAAAGI